jgi:hypothetical protein
MSDEDQAARRDRRFKTFLPAAASTAGGGEHRVHVLDLSRSGARLHADTSFDPSDTLLLDLHGVKHSARVVWSRGKQIGVVFTMALTPDELRRIDQSLPHNSADGRPAAAVASGTR